MRLVSCDAIKRGVMGVSELRTHGLKLYLSQERKLSLSLSHTQTNAAVQSQAFIQSKIEKPRTLSSSWAVYPPCMKGHYSTLLHSHHISTITLLGTAPGHTKQPVVHKDIIVSGDRGHCRPYCGIYSPPPILGPSTLTLAAISHALGPGACEALCLQVLKKSPLQCLKLT